jgi:hypothetical protein
VTKTIGIIQKVNSALHLLCQEWLEEANTLGSDFVSNWAELEGKLRGLVGKDAAIGPTGFMAMIQCKPRYTAAGITGALRTSRWLLICRRS